MANDLSYGDCGCPCSLPCIVSRTVVVYGAGPCGTVDFLTQLFLPGGLEGRFKKITSTTTNETGTVTGVIQYFRGPDNIECQQSFTKTGSQQGAVELPQSFNGTVEEISRTATKVVTHFKLESGDVFQTVVIELSEYDDSFTPENEFQNLKGFADGFILQSLPWGAFVRVFLDANFSESSRETDLGGEAEGGLATYDARFVGGSGLNGSSFRRAEALIQPVGVNGTCCYCIYENAIDLFGNFVEEPALIETNNYQDSSGNGFCTQISGDRIVPLDPRFVAGAQYGKAVQAGSGGFEICRGPVIP